MFKPISVKFEMTIEPNHINNGLTTKKLFQDMARWQLIATLAVACIAFLLGGLHAFFSALAGGLSVLIGSFLASKIAANDAKKEAASVLINLLKAEACKIIVIALLLLGVFVLYKPLVPIALIAGLAAAAFFSGAALAKADRPI